ncbi:MAG: glycosyltransferase [Caulobacteraceae bacterium]|nr:glycosyltransferase [Caulobacteraceae bacterium]
MIEHGRAERRGPGEVHLVAAEIMGSSSGGFRQTRWCEYFLERGCRVIILCQNGLTRVDVQRVDDVTELRTLRTGWTRHRPSRTGARTGWLAHLARRAKHLLVADLFYPSVWMMTWRLVRLVRGSAERAVVLCSSPPFSMALIGAVVKSIFPSRVVFALDMRDLWSLHSALPGPRLHKRLLERWVLRRADVLTAVSVGLAERFESRFGVKARVIYNVATHVVDSDLPAPPMSWSVWSRLLRAGSRKLVYTGSVPEGFYDLATFVDACADFVTSRPDAIDRLQLVFVGASGELQKVATKRLPEGAIVYLPIVSHADVNRIQSAADALLFLGYHSSDNQGQVSTKLFEYFRRGLPILPVDIKSGSDVDYLIKLYCGSCPRLISRSDIAHALAQVAEGDMSALPRSLNADADRDLLGAYGRAADDILALKDRASPLFDPPIMPRADAC